VNIRRCDVAVVGGGLAGSLAAAMLGRERFETVLIDLHEVYPPDFRCEKLDGGQVAILEKTGFAEAVLSAASCDGSAYVARFGRLLDNKPSDQWGIRYDTLVNRIRAEVGGRSMFLHGKVKGIATTSERQCVTLTSGETVSARLVVLATGLNTGLRHSLGIERQIVSACHSVTAGFDVLPAEGGAFTFNALTYYPERASDRLAYLTLFPIGNVMRANLMTYRDMDDPWLSRLRHEPAAALIEAFPRLPKVLGRFQVAGPVRIRPADLYVTRDYLKPGIVLVGDAFATSCPAAGTGAGKVFADVERLCNVHIPRWLASGGMGMEKIATFYADPIKRASDRRSLAKAYHLRALSTGAGAYWRVLRGKKFLARFALGQLRRAGRLRGLQAPAPLPPRLPKPIAAQWQARPGEAFAKLRYVLAFLGL
jgi:2-polyprenyl-6-methoxyphenol hydroxylase-like FAD-dependent oxidoreductase